MKRVGYLILWGVTIETERLILTTWNESDWREFRPIASDPDVMRYINDGRPWSDERIKAFVSRQIQLFDAHSFCRWKLIEKSTQLLIGFCGIGFWMDNPDAEIGWWLAKHKWGQGFATEAARATLDDAFNRVGLRKIISVAQPANQASIRIMTKLGMSQESTFEWKNMKLVRDGINAPSLLRRGQIIERQRWWPCECL